MTLSKIPLLMTICCLWNTELISQKFDTIKIDATKINTSVLKPGTHRYLVYFKNGKDSSRINYQFWSRKIELIHYKGKDAISITQEWENNQNIFHKVNSICERKSFLPLYHETWWRRSGASIFDFISKTVSVKGELLTDSDTSKTKKAIYQAFKASLQQYVLNWHLDLEVFPVLPYKDKVTFLINFYDPGYSPLHMKCTQ
jgi:hypothetical protein